MNRLPLAAAAAVLLSLTYLPAQAAAASGGDAELSPEVTAKLTGDQLYKVLQGRHPEEVSHPESVLIPIASFVMIVAIVGLFFFASVVKDRQRHQTLRALIEKGAEIPPLLLMGRAARGQDLRRGVLLSSLGLGLGVVLAALPVEVPHLWALGVIPVLIGAGYLVCAKLLPEPPPPPLSKAS